MIIEISVILGALSIMLTCIFIVRKLTKTDFFVDILEDFISDLVENEDLRKQAYMLGGLFGAGIGQNLGQIMGGKMKPKDLLMNIMSNWFQNAFNKPQSSGSNTAQNKPIEPNKQEGFF